ncbi:Signal transduction histidine kinase [Brevibacterium siliguriense]|uniref:histidine kinase n=1 Tax=Brevibacterium siliguriense TaxID=1136497 RepID=A0A1H1V6Q8_9MICO|nr:sensor histidine kinase [Brevibacterium siliguriense]SDS80494.1 Signal transduction histidine kinase [Brevibacterium siliguriense]
MSTLLARARHLDVWLLVVLVVLLVTSSIRYILRHGFSGAGILVLIGAFALLLCYGARPKLRKATAASRVWSVAMALLVAALSVIAPSFAWCAVPVAFVVLRALPFRWAVACVSALVVVVALSWLRISPSPDITIVVGPLGIALITIMSYRSLDKESQARARLIDQLVATQDELVSEQRRVGALRERTRLSRDIHDSIGQDLSSIHLLLQATEYCWESRPERARENVATAIESSRQSLTEIRRVIYDLSTDVDKADYVAPEELRQRLVEFVRSVKSEPTVELRVDGAEKPLTDQIARAVVATARGAIANVLEHANASRVVVTVTFAQARVYLDVRDNGRGFDTRYPTMQSRDGDESNPKLRGRGLRGIRERARELGGEAEVDSEIGDGTTVSAWFPIRKEQG